MGLVLGFLLFCFSFSNKSHAEVNEYGWDCSANPFVSSCGWNPPTADQHTISDDSWVSVPLQFAFPFGTQVFTHSWMHSNGVISFLGTTDPTMSHLCCDGVDMQNYTGNFYQYMIAPLWTDLINIPKDLDGDGINDTGFYTEGDDESMKYFWRNISEFYNDKTNNNFGVEINDTGNIDMYHYGVDIQTHNVFTGVIGATGEIQQDYFGQGRNIDDYAQLSNYETTYEFVGDPTVSGIPSFTQADFVTNCSANPLYDTRCYGYAEAYAAYLFAQQCNADPLYDTACSGYEQAYYDTYVAPYINTGVEEETTNNTTTTEEDTTDVGVVDVVESLVNTEITGNAVVDEILRDSVTTFNAPIVETNTQPVEEVVIETTVEEPETLEIASLEETIEEGEANDTREPEPSGDVEERVEGSGNEESQDGEQGNSEPTDQETDGGTQSEEQAGETEKPKETKESRKKKVKKLVAKRASQLADRMGTAASIEAQQQIQNQVLALIGFNPDFTAYAAMGIGQPTFYEVDQMQDGFIPNSQRGLRNGLAQQILHEKMVDMQYK